MWFFILAIISSIIFFITDVYPFLDDYMMYPDTGELNLFFHLKKIFFRSLFTDWANWFWITPSWLYRPTEMPLCLFLVGNYQVGNFSLKKASLRALIENAVDMFSPEVINNPNFSEEKIKKHLDYCKKNMVTTEKIVILKLKN